MRVGLRVRCSVPFPERLRGVEAEANWILDNFRPSDLPPREEALFLWNDPDDARYWMESCISLGGVAELYLVRVPKNATCIICDFMHIEDLFWDLEVGADEEEVEEEAKAYWASCKPWKGQRESNTEVLCWGATEAEKIKVGEARTLNEIRQLIKKAKEILASKK